VQRRYRSVKVSSNEESSFPWMYVTLPFSHRTTETKWSRKSGSTTFLSGNGINRSLQGMSQTRAVASAAQLPGQTTNHPTICSMPRHLSLPHSHHVTDISTAVYIKTAQRLMIYTSCLCRPLYGSSYTPQILTPNSSVITA
jgi:hypothetical protein